MKNFPASGRKGREGRLSGISGFSGLLGGVLKGETLSSEVVCSNVGARALTSAWDRFDPLPRIFGLSALFTGGGTEALLAFPTGEFPLSNKCSEFPSLAPAYPKLGVNGRPYGRGGVDREAVSEVPTALRE